MDHFLSSFKCLEQLSLIAGSYNGVIQAICNMENGLKYLKLSECSLQDQDLSCLAMSKHAQTLLQIDICHIAINNNSAAGGLIALCQNLFKIAF